MNKPRSCRICRDQVVVGNLEIELDQVVVVDLDVKDDQDIIVDLDVEDDQDVAESTAAAGSDGSESTIQSTDRNSSRYTEI